MAVINKFHNSKIYTIRSPQTNKYYIGATTQILCKRLTNHKSSYKAYLDGIGGFTTSFKILELGDAYIELLEEINCENNNQLQKREGELIRKHKLELVNKFIPGQTRLEYRTSNKVKISEFYKQYYKANKDKISKHNMQYTLDNKDKISEYNHQYCIENKDKILEYHKQYYEANKDKISECRKQYYKQYYKANKDKISKHNMQYNEANKDKISEQKTKQITCECGSIIQQCETSRHNKSKKHIAFINTIIV